MTAKATINNNNNNNNIIASKRISIRNNNNNVTTTVNNNNNNNNQEGNNNNNNNNNRVGEPRRANKPLMEKRRRARINQSLAVLKTLILDSAKSDNTKHSKLEKADILELTVRHFQRHRNLDTPGLNKYRAGYADCVREVQRYLETPDAQTMCVIEPGIRQRLLRHLERCVSEIDTDISPQQQLTTLTPPPATVPSTTTTTTTITETLYKTIPKLPTQQIQEQRMDFTPTKSESSDEFQPEGNEELKIKLEPDSSTAEEINNNNNITEPNCRSEMLPPQQQQQNHQHVTTLPNNVIRMYDGNFVFVLPSHYIQLAEALGINLSNQVTPVVNGSEGNPSETTPARTIIIPQHQNEISQQIVARGCGAEKPIDYSKNNNDDMNENMWRPW